MPSTSEESENHLKFEKPNLKGDRLNFVLLTFLYVLQGAVFGLTSAIPFVLQKRNVTYKDQAQFSVVGYSYSFKILWAPIVDSIYSKRMGRRKTWLVPTQYLIGILLLLVSMNIDSWLGTEDGSQRPNIRILTVVFFMCVFFSSTQDVAVDGWSLTIFQKKNVGFSALSQSMGLSFGYFLAFVGFIMLDSKDFCNIFRSVPRDYGFVTFSNFIFFWAVAFIVTTTIVLLFKKEMDIDDIDNNNDPKLGMKETYEYLWKILKIPSIRMIAIFLLTLHIGFGPLKSVSPLKLIDAGVPRDVLAFLSVPSLPFQLILPMVLSRFLTGPRPMRIFLIFYVLRLVNAVVYGVLIYFISHSKGLSNALPTWFYWPLVFIHNFENLTDSVDGMALTSLFARISDPRFGGVYMTLLNCLTNAGRHSVSTLCLWLVDSLTIKACSKYEVAILLQKLSPCRIIIDGFYVEMFIFVTLGVLWLFWGKKQIYNLEKRDPCAYLVEEKPKVVKKDSLLPTVINGTQE